MFKVVPLTQGYVSIVDETDYSRVTEHSWCIQQYKNKSRGKNVYAKASIGRTQVTLHRFILGAPKGTFVDHINGDTLDNRRENLRYTTKQGNAANRIKDRIPNKTSEFKGVSKKPKGRWTATITVMNQPIHLGTFLDEVSAARAYDAAARRYFGEFCKVNFDG